MDIRIDFRSEQPIYLQIVEQVRDLVRTDLVPGDQPHGAPDAPICGDFTTARPTGFWMSGLIPPARMRTHVVRYHPMRPAGVCTTRAFMSR
jgi:hypothetical protein